MVTPFQKRVHDALLLIPRGKVTTYKLLGDFIGCKSAQAIGQALTKNPYAPEIPCHRVIRTNGTIGGYALGVSQKRAILASESIHFDKKGFLLAPQDSLWQFIS